MRRSELPALSSDLFSAAMAEPLLDRASVLLVANDSRLRTLALRQLDRERRRVFTCTVDDADDVCRAILVDVVVAFGDTDAQTDELREGLAALVVPPRRVVIVPPEARALLELDEREHTSVG